MELPSSVSINEISITGLYKDSEVERIRVALKFFLEHQKGLKASLKYLLPMDYEILIDDLKKEPKFHESPLMLYKGSTSPLIIVNQKYVIKPQSLYENLYKVFFYEDNTAGFIYNRRAMTEYARFFAENKRYEYVYMDFVIEHERYELPQRVVFALDMQNAPKTCQNFIELIKGTHKGPDGKPLCYKDTIIHKVWENGFIQGGDVENLKGKGGYSIYGKHFEDENYILKHDRPGLLGMANNGLKHSNSSQFYVTLMPMPKYDNKSVVFGQVVEGFRIVKLMNKLQSYGCKPLYRIYVNDCGMYTYNLKKVAMKRPFRRNKY